jgi:hypothetical protein
MAGQAAEISIFARNFMKIKAKVMQMRRPMQEANDLRRRQQ